MIFSGGQENRCYGDFTRRYKSLMRRLYLKLPVKGSRIFFRGEIKVLNLTVVLEILLALRIVYSGGFFFFTTAGNDFPAFFFGGEGGNVIYRRFRVTSVVEIRCGGSN